MESFANRAILNHANTMKPKQFDQNPFIIANKISNGTAKEGRRSIISTMIAAPLVSLSVAIQSTPPAMAENWGTRSFIKEKFFEPSLSPEDSVARIRQTAEGMKSLREMLDRMAWRYVIFYIRLKSSYLNSDLKNAMEILPENLRKNYVKTANELVDNMAELDYYVRTPKVYESYVYYEKTLKSLDDLVAILA